MHEHEKTKGARRSDGSRRPLKVLSTSLGVALATNLLLTPGMLGESAAHAGATEPTLVEWSSDAVKAYFNPSLDWSLPLPAASGAQPGESPEPGTGSGGGGGTQPVIIHQGGFGWDDLLLYHMIFNNGGIYSSSGWHKKHPVYDPRTNQPYRPKTYSTGAFENKPVPGTNVKPKTSAASGSFRTKSSLSSSKNSSSSSSGKVKSSSSGSIGGKSGGFSSSGS